MLRKHGWKRPISYGVIILLLLMISGVTGCARQQAVPRSDTKTKFSDKFLQKFIVPKVGVLLTKEDPLLDQAVSTSLSNIANQDSVDLKLLQANELTNTEDGVRYLAENGYQLIIGLAPDFEEVIKKIGKEYPEVHFLIFDGQLRANNVVNIKFKSEEAGFLAGALAAQLTKTGLVGFVGDGKNDQQTIAEQAGFYQGVNYINTQLNTMVRIKGSFLGDKAAEAKVQKAKTVALAELDSGADIIFQAAGLAGDGVFQAAGQKGGLVIGSQQNQNWKLPGQVPASAVYNLNDVFKTILSQLHNQKLQGGTQTFSVANGGITYTDLRKIELEEKIGVKYKQVQLDRILQIKSWVPDAVAAQMQFIRTGIAKGSIKVSARVNEDYLKSLAPLPAPIPPTPAPTPPKKQNPPKTAEPKTPATEQPTPPATQPPESQQPSPQPPETQVPGGQTPTKPPVNQTPSPVPGETPSPPPSPVQ